MCFRPFVRRHYRRPNYGNRNMNMLYVFNFTFTYTLSRNRRQKKMGLLACVFVDNSQPRSSQGAMDVIALSLTSVQRPLTKTAVLRGYKPLFFLVCRFIFSILRSLLPFSNLSDIHSPGGSPSFSIALCPFLQDLFCSLVLIASSEVVGGL